MLGEMSGQTGHCSEFPYMRNEGSNCTWNDTHFLQSTPYPHPLRLVGKTVEHMYLKVFKTRLKNLVNMCKEQKHQESVYIHPLPALWDNCYNCFSCKTFSKCQVMQGMKRYLAIWPTFNYPWQWETGIVEIIKIHRLSSNFSLIACTLLLLHQACWKCYLKICFDSGFISFHVPCPPNRGNNRKPYLLFYLQGLIKNLDHSRCSKILNC